MTNRATPKLVLMILAAMMAVTVPAKPQAIDWDSAASRQEIQSFQQFLANHPWIAGKLKENPSLANDSGFLRRSPELAHFLNAHPLVQTDFKIDASGVMSRAQVGKAPSNNSANYQEMYNFNRFLSAHPWIADKLRDNPALANEKGFVRGSHELEEFLNSHPYVQAQFRADPYQFMRQVRALPPESPGSFDSSASDYAALRAFLQNHQWIAERLKEDATRANDKDFLDKSKELRQFLEAHPSLQDQFKQNPRRTLEQATTQAGGEYF